MSGRRAKMLRRVAKHQFMEIGKLKKRYSSMNLPTRLNFIKVDGQYITLSNEFIDQLKLGVYPSNSSQSGQGSVG